MSNMWKSKRKKKSEEQCESVIDEAEEIRRKSLSRMHQLNDKVFGLIFMVIFVSPLLCIAFITMGTHHGPATIPILLACMAVLIGISACVAKYCLRPRALDEIITTAGSKTTNIAETTEDAATTEPERQTLLKHGAQTSDICSFQSAGVLERDESNSKGGVMKNSDVTIIICPAENMSVIQESEIKRENHISSSSQKSEIDVEMSMDHFAQTVCNTANDKDGQLSFPGNDSIEGNTSCDVDIHIKSQSSV
ncbi:uncharacterized protein LOC144435295 [Glandiceps talaboti]